jgi:hypothetical protein
MLVKLSTVVSRLVITRHSKQSAQCNVGEIDSSTKHIEETFFFKIERLLIWAMSRALTREKIQYFKKKKKLGTEKRSKDKNIEIYVNFFY